MKKQEQLMEFCESIAKFRIEHSGEPDLSDKVHEACIAFLEHIGVSYELAEIAISAHEEDYESLSHDVRIELSLLIIDILHMLPHNQVQKLSEKSHSPYMSNQILEALEDKQETTWWVS